MKITIVFRDKNIKVYRNNEYTEYDYNGKYFIVIRNTQWIGMYNLDDIKYIEVTED